MAIDSDTYYYFVDEMGLRPLWWELYKLDKYPALRYMLIMEQIHCIENVVKNYDKQGDLDELSYSKDMHHGVFDEIMLKKLKIAHGKEYDFFTIAIKIETQKTIYIKSSDQFPIESKLEYMRTMLKAMQLRRLFEPSFVPMSNEYVNYLEKSIVEIEADAERNSFGAVVSKVTDKPNMQPKEESTFESFFIDQEMIQPLLKFLTKENVISASGKWMGKKKRKTDLMGFIDALQAMDLIEFKNQTEVGSAFYKRFKLNINIRSVTLPTGIRDDACEIYQELLDDFLLDYNQKKQLEIAK